MYWKEFGLPPPTASHAENLASSGGYSYPGSPWSSSGGHYSGMGGSAMGRPYYSSIGRPYYSGIGGSAIGRPYSGMGPYRNPVPNQSGSSSYFANGENYGGFSSPLSFSPYRPSVDRLVGDNGQVAAVNQPASAASASSYSSKYVAPKPPKTSRYISNYVESNFGGATIGKYPAELYAVPGPYPVAFRPLAPRPYSPIAVPGPKYPGVLPRPYPVGIPRPYSLPIPKPIGNGHIKDVTLMPYPTPARPNPVMGYPYPAIYPPFRYPSPLVGSGYHVGRLTAPAPNPNQFLNAATQSKVSTGRTFSNEISSEYISPEVEELISLGLGLPSSDNISPIPIDMIHCYPDIYVTDKSGALVRGFAPSPIKEMRCVFSWKRPGSKNSNLALIPINEGFLVAKGKLGFSSTSRGNAHERHKCKKKKKPGHGKPKPASHKPAQAEYSALSSTPKPTGTLLFFRHVTKKPKGRSGKIPNYITSTTPSGKGGKKRQTTPTTNPKTDGTKKPRKSLSTTPVPVVTTHLSKKQKTYLASSTVLPVTTKKTKKGSIPSTPSSQVSTTKNIRGTTPRPGGTATIAPKKRKESAFSPISARPLPLPMKRFYMRTLGGNLQTTEQNLVLRRVRFLRSRAGLRRGRRGRKGKKKRKKGKRGRKGRKKNKKKGRRGRKKG